MSYTIGWHPQMLRAAGWARVDQEEHLMGRASEAGDEVGSGLIGKRVLSLQIGRLGQA